ncbi:hypothetical protein J6S37_01595, partial [Candidatus Saccharibacteria bacterium]|nr:hypothetical protein [Candidatus Saccharibacteria bacterium]
TMVCLMCSMVKFISTVTIIIGTLLRPATVLIKDQRVFIIRVATFVRRAGTFLTEAQIPELVAATIVGASIT